MLGVTASGQPMGTAAKVQPAAQRVGPLGATGTAVAPTPVSAVREKSEPFSQQNQAPNFCGVSNRKPLFSQETLENVKKCRNFLSTLIKLASGKQSPQTSANVKELIKNLLVLPPHMIWSSGLFFLLHSFLLILFCAFIEIASKNRA